MQRIENQLNKLVDVIDIKRLEPETSICRELIMIKLKVSEENRQSLIAVANIFRAKIVDVAKESLVIELTGDQSKVDAFIDLLSGYEILELARAGYHRSVPGHLRCEDVRRGRQTDGLRFQLIRQYLCYDTSGDCIPGCGPGCRRLKHKIIYTE